MQSFINPVISSSQEGKEIVEIKMWSLYLLTNASSVYNSILESSIDHGPVEKNPHKPGRITFRFSSKEWEGKIKRLLYANRIPVIVKTDSFVSYTFNKHQRLVA
jgi:hypothetical protein